MINCSKHLLDLSKKVTKVYTQWDGIKAIGVGASISKNQATPYSDLDIIMIYDELPTDKFLKEASIINKGKKRKVHNKNETGCLEIYYVDGVECQFSQVHFSFYEEIVKEIIENKSTDQVPHLIADGLRTVIPIYGEEYFQSLNNRLEKFPPELALKMVEKHLSFGPFDELRYRFQKEDNIIWSTDVISIYIKRILSCLLAANNQYIPGDFRKIKPVIEALKVKPANLYKQIMKIYSNPPRDILDDLYQLTIEMLEIVKEQIPDFEINSRLEKFQEAHPKLDISKIK